jgi:hypothetical protein
VLKLLAMLGALLAALALPSGAQGAVLFAGVHVHVV